MSEEWKVGDPVVKIYARGSIDGADYGPFDRVAKIHKNGNVLLEGRRAQQFRPSFDDLYQTGDGYYRDRYVRLTPEIEADVSRSHEIRRRRGKLSDLRELLTRPTGDAIMSLDMDVVAALIAYLKGGRPE